jgi:radical SAM superfamily enzyme YgiQ (UPF0313 family)
LHKYINRNKRSTLILAPEAVSDRLRSIIGKYLSEKQIVETLLTANAIGLKAIKFYFMIGLPRKSDENLSGIEQLGKLVKKEIKGLIFTVTVSPFVPKSQTAFQWTSMSNVETIKQKIEGDNRLSMVIYKAWQKVAKSDQWVDKFDNNIWDDEDFTENNVNLIFYIYRNRKSDEGFPCNHLFFGMFKLKLDYVKGINETTDTLIKQFEKSNCLLTANYVEPTIFVLPHTMRLRLRFSKRGTVKFISHLEQIKVFRRTARCSNLPIAFTSGFSPQVKSSYGPPPLSIGQESASEYVVFYAKS